MSKRLCPYCHDEHGLSDCITQCLNDKSICPYGITYETYECTIEGRVVERISKVVPKSKKKICEKCQIPTRLLCPRIGKEIPSKIFATSKSLPVALVGGKGSGKSNYIAVLVPTIQYKMAIPFNCFADFASVQESWDTYKLRYYNPLYNAKKVIPGTDLSEQPAMVFPINFLNTNNSGIKSIVPLTLYDSAGENFEQVAISKLVEKNKYTIKSKGIIMLIDPYRLPKIKSLIKEELIKKQGMSIKLPEDDVAETGKVTEPDQILGVITKLLRSALRVKDKVKLKVPVAVVLTKCDIFDKLGLIPEGSILKSESSYLDKAAFDERERAATDTEIRALIEARLDDPIGQNVLMLLRANYENFSFFMVSAFGTSPVVDENGEESINTLDPFRVLDPLLWLLSVHKYIDTINKK